MRYLFVMRIAIRRAAASVIVIARASERARALIMNRTIRISRSFVRSFVRSFIRTFQGSKRGSRRRPNKKMFHRNRGGFIREAIKT